MITQQQEEIVSRALDSFQIEIPSWGFANTGTRFGKFVQYILFRKQDEIRVGKGMASYFMAGLRNQADLLF